MVKVVVGKLNGKRSAVRTAVREERVRDPEGGSKTVWSLDAGSPTFSADFRYVFQKNVAKARRENKRLTGKADIDLKR